MIDLPDYGYVSRRIVAIDPGGSVDGSLGGPSDYINRPGYRYSVQFDLPPMPVKEARMFEALLEQASRSDASYPLPLDQKSMSAGVPLINGSNPPGATLSIKGLVPGFQFRLGQPFAVIAADGTGYIHKASAAVSVGNTGIASVPIFPLSRTTFTDGLVVEIERPRIRGILHYDGSTQGPNGSRAFSFTIAERR